MLTRIDPLRRLLKTRFADGWRLTGLFFGVALTLVWIGFLGYLVLSVIESVV